MLRHRWVKVNMDCVARGNLGHDASGGIFKDSRGNYIESFSAYFIIFITLYVELYAVILIK